MVAPAAASAATRWVAQPPETVGGNTSCSDPGYVEASGQPALAIQAAFNEASPGDTVHICPGTWTVIDDLTLSIPETITVEGGGRDQTTVDSDHRTLLFVAEKGVTLRDLTIRDAISEFGSAIVAVEPLLIEDAALIGNGGGTVQVVGFSGVNIRRSLFEGREDSDAGGFLWSMGDVTISDSTFRNNKPSSFPPGILSAPFSGIEFPSAKITVDASTFTNLDGPCFSAISNAYPYNVDGGIEITNSTFTGNGVTGGVDCSGLVPLPPAIISGEIVDLKSSTVAEDPTDTNRGIFGLELRIGNSILDVGGCDFDVRSNLGGNVVSEETPGCDDFVGGPAPSLPAKVPAASIALDPLALNPPGTTETMALGASSVARGAAIAADCPATDQRGVSRPADNCDSGAYQYGAPETYKLTVTKSGTGSGSVTSTPAGIDCGSTCEANFDDGASVTLTATAASGSTFTGWSGPCTGTGTCSVTMNEARSVTASFTADSPPPSGKPKLKLSVKTPKKVKAGSTFDVTVKTSNVAPANATRASSSRSATTATQVRTCAKLPKGLFVVKRNGGKVKGRTVCWTRSSLAAGQSATYKATVRSSKTRSGSVKVSGTASASNDAGATVKASGSSRVRIVKPKAPKPKPPTG